MNQAQIHIDQTVCQIGVNNIADRSPSKLWTLAMTLELWHRRVQTRRHLAKLDHDQLNDIGVSFEQARDEMKKPFWVC
ncbi:MAG: DUF1127 domain-containing protein [Pseudomonadota bacterium]